MARLTIAWVKEYAKTNGIFLVKTSTGYAVQYQRLIDELTFEDGIGYKEVFKTLKEVKEWIDDQNPVDVLGINEEVAKEIYEDAKKFSDKVDREMGVDREEEVKTPLETYVDGVVSREKWILSLTEDELDNSGLSDQEVSFWVKNQNKSEDATLESSEIKETKNGGSFTYKLLKSFDDDSRRYFEITYQVFNDQNLVLIDDGFNFNLNYSKDAAKIHALTFLNKGYRGLLWFNDEEIKESMPLTFEEVNEYAKNCGYELTLGDNRACTYKEVYNLILPSGKVHKVSWLNGVIDVIKGGELLNKEFCALPLPKSLKITPCHKLISLENGELTMVKDFKLSAIAKLPLEENEEVKTFPKNEFHLKLSELKHPLALPGINPWQIRRSLYCTNGVKFPHPDEYEGFIIPDEEETEESLKWLRKHKVIK